MLEHRFCGIHAGSARVLLPSAGLRYTYTASARGVADCAAANAVDPVSITLAGVPPDLAASYRVTGNTFLAEAYLAANAAGMAPPATDRIDVLP